MKNFDETGNELFHMSISTHRHLGVRPLCPCCGGGERRGSYSMTKAKSRRKGSKAKKARKLSNSRMTIRKDFL